ncbi:MAG: O-antigen ligase family protein [Blastocatellia bacterium]
MPLTERINRQLDSVIAIGLVVAVVFTALSHGAVEPWSVAVFELMMIALLLLWGISMVVTGRLRIHLPATVWPLLALLALGLTQCIVVRDSAGARLSLSKDIEATRMVVLLLFCLIVACVIAVNFFKRRERLQALLNFLVIFGLALAVFGLIQHFAWNGKLYWLRPLTVAAASPFGPFVNHNHFAGYLEMLAPLPVALIVTGAASRGRRLFYLFAAAMMGIAVVASLSRAGMISLLAAMLFLLALSFRLRPQPGRLQHAASRLGSASAVIVVSLAIVAGIFWIGADPVIDRVTNGKLAGAEAGAETFHTSRGWIWKDTVRMISASPVLGVGLGAYQTAWPNYSEADGALIVDKAHNDYLQLLAEAGIIGGLLALWFIVTVFRLVAQGLRSPDPLMMATAMGSAAGITAMLVHSFFDFNLQLPSNSLLFLLLTATATQAAAAPETVRDAARARQGAMTVSSAESDLVAGVQWH